MLNFMFLFRPLFPTPKTNFVNFKRRKTEVLKTLNWTFEVLALETFGIVQYLKLSWYQGPSLFLISVKKLAIKFCKTCEKSFLIIMVWWHFIRCKKIYQECNIKDIVRMSRMFSGNLQLLNCNIFTAADSRVIFSDFGVIFMFSLPSNFWVS